MYISYIIFIIGLCNKFIIIAFLWSGVKYCILLIIVLEGEKNACLYIFTYLQKKWILKNDYFHFQKYPLFTVILLTLYLAVKNMFISKNSWFQLPLFMLSDAFLQMVLLTISGLFIKCYLTQGRRKESDARCSVQDSESKDVTWNPCSIAFCSNFVFDFSEARITSIIYTYFSDFFRVRHFIYFSNLSAVFYQSQILTSFMAQWNTSEFQGIFSPAKHQSQAEVKLKRLADI